MWKRIMLGFWVSAILLLAAAMIVSYAAAPQSPNPAPPFQEGTVMVDAGEDQSATPGASVTLTVAVSVEDGSDVIGYAWEQTAGAPTEISGADSDTLTVTLGDADAYKAELISSLRTEDRFRVQPINPHSLEAAETVTFMVTVTTTSGSYSDTVNVTTGLPYVISTGINNVPINEPVLLQGKAQDSYDWTLTVPDGSSATLDDAASQNPSFTPDVVGKYTLTEGTSGTTFDVYAGTWKGIIIGMDENGEPTVDTTCTTCHNGTIAPDEITPWKASGHAEIFTQNIDNPSGHWSLSCAGCHTVGYDPGADNGGFDEAMAQENWEVPHGALDNWANMLAEYPETARLANIQCENCHGPQDSDAHMQGAVRESLSSELCGACHGEPLRHGRYQQWEESGHANLDLAIEEATVEARGTSAAHCGRCHSAQGFLAWIQQGDLTLNIQGADGNATEEELIALGLTEDTVESQTCAVCHDPHAQGKQSGEPNTATVRIQGSTPMLPAGFKAVGVGRGAICITCHNTRNGAHNDEVTVTADDRAPHTAAQGDVLMGENAYFVPTGQRSKHSLLSDTCATCHMELTPPPAELSYNLSGTNHTFEASLTVCAQCHGAFDGGTLPEVVEVGAEELKAAIEQAIVAEISAQTEQGNTVTLVKMGEGETDVNITDGSTVSAVELTESHGRIAMNITVSDTTYEHVRIGSDTAVKDASGEEFGSLVDSPAGQIIAKAGWNYFLIHSDGSDGVHNPSFVLDVLRASVNALK